MIPALIERELRAALRKKAARVRFWTALLGVLYTLCCILLPRWLLGGNVGQRLFHFLFFLACAQTAYETFNFSIDVISLERRNKTLGLLILTGMSPKEIFFSKLAAAVVPEFCNGLALLPCFAISFLLGGVPRTAFLAAAFFVPALTFLTLSVCLFASTVARDEDSGSMLAIAVGGILSLSAPAAFYLYSWLGSVTWDRAILLLSPVYGFGLIWDFFKSGTLLSFWLNGAVMAGYSTILLLLAGRFLKRGWRLEVEGTSNPVKAVGSFKADPSIRRWLDVNPFVWLALRDRQPNHLAWTAVGLIAGVWSIGYLFFPHAWGTLVCTLLAGIALYAVVGLMAMFAVAKRIADDRRTGAMEFLLTTPLSVDEIVEGQRRALSLSFRPLLVSLPFMLAGLAAATLLSRSWDLLSGVVFLECWGILLCLIALALRSETISSVIWTALNSGRPILALRKVVCPPNVLVCFSFFAYNIAKAGLLESFPQGSLVEFWIITTVLVITGLLGMLSGRWDASTTRLFRNFRWVTQQPLPEPSDPRFRHWDPTKPFPESKEIAWLGRFS